MSELLLLFGRGAFLAQNYTVFGSVFPSKTVLTFNSALSHSLTFSSHWRQYCQQCYCWSWWHGLQDSKFIYAAWS